MAATVVPVVGTVLSLIRHPHWIFRVWDFPRVQMAVTTLIGSAGYLRFFSRGKRRDAALLVPAALAVGWQLYKIYPYTKLARKQVKAADRLNRRNTLSVMVSNVQMENEEHDRLIALVKERQPDVLMVVETDDPWASALEDALGDDYPHRIAQPQDNWYGLMLFSKLELRKPAIEFLVQEDIPSAHARIALRSGVEVEVHLLHPRPPEPVRGQRSTPRDAELIVVGKSIEKKRDVPTIVAGDLNDVAWSETSQLFVRLSRLLDPRIGRGFYNSYNARNPLARFPLDHIFHSNHFKLIRLERLPAIGSDHFPIYAELLYAPEARAEQKPAKKKAGDEAQAAARLEKEREEAATGDDRPG
ncbi:MAG: endonuclease/exonuclease/phosphatase family protein [Thermoanaerobaculia bacterium]